ncbi:rhamnosyltransferase [Sodalis sp. dw_96]|uniref:rhamnosyltransferase n=1 Tax=Sodalis sp. dw_96 TaxID=2719794 RepID=UPI001BD6A210|nr:rhamnosyltransferase [Sodalis sp. dw_96]
MTAPWSRICAVIVTYNPDVSLFAEVIAAISGQVQEVIIVDNGSAEPSRTALSEIVQDSAHRHLILNEDNQGIAAGQNCGIALALMWGCTHTLLLDQDSIPAADMVSQLIAMESTLLARNIEVGAVGATTVDRRTSTRARFVRKRGVLIHRCSPRRPEDPIETDFLISSGTLIRTAAIKDIGLMNDGYFIDHVDTEWCFRATHKGYRLFGSAKALLSHSLGDAVIKIWFARWREVPRHNPLRNYYTFRNTIRMLYHTPMSVSWRLAHGYRLVMFFIFLLIAGKPRITRLKMMLLGLVHGVKGVQGIFISDRRT